MWLESMFEHYTNGQDLNLLDRPHWHQETLLIFQREVELIKIDVQQRQQKKGFKDGR